MQLFRVIFNESINLNYLIKIWIFIRCFNKFVITKWTIFKHINCCTIPNFISIAYYWIMLSCIEIFIQISFYCVIFENKQTNFCLLIRTIVSHRFCPLILFWQFIYTSINVHFFFLLTKNKKSSVSNRQVTTNKW